MKDLDLSKIFDSMKTNDISEVIITEGKQSYEIRRGGFKNSGNQQQVVQQVGSAVIPANNTVQQQVSTSTPSNDIPANEDTSSSNYYELKSPLVGTFYSAKNPESPAFVEVGQKVTKGQTVCIVEAMKNFNEIESEVDGVIKEICVNNSELVEFHQVLFKIEQA